MPPTVRGHALHHHRRVPALMPLEQQGRPTPVRTRMTRSHQTLARRVQAISYRSIAMSGARATPPSKHILLERRCALRRLNWLVLGGIDCYDLVRRSRLPPGSAHLVRDFDSTHAPVRASPRTGVLFYNEKAKAQALGRGAGPFFGRAKARDGDRRSFDKSRELAPMVDPEFARIHSV